MKSDKLFFLGISQEKSLKKYTITYSNQYNEIAFNKIAFNYKNGYYIYELIK